MRGTPFIIRRGCCDDLAMECATQPPVMPAVGKTLIFHNCGGWPAVPCDKPHPNSMHAGQPVCPVPSTDTHTGAFHTRTKEKSA
eukprot:SAG11_NODE_4108_length_2048_cov_1.508915_2_plen_84_part_00